MQRVTFTPEMDTLLLREVIANQAFAMKNGTGWRQTADKLIKLPNFTPILTARTVRERTNSLVNQFRRENSANEKRYTYYT